MNDIELKHTHFILLGLVAEYPSHAYDINKRIEERGMRNWTNIGAPSQSTIYNILDKFEEDYLVESHREEKDNRIRKVYTISNKGMEVLKRQVYKVISEFIGRNDENFYVAFSMFPILSPKKQIEAFSTSLKKVKKHKKELEKMLDKMLAEVPSMSVNVTGLFIHPIKILQTDIEFLKLVLEEIKKVGGKVEPEAYGK